MEKNVGVVIINFESGEDLIHCVSSVLEQDGVLDVVVVDNGSTDLSVSRMQLLHPKIRVITPSINLGFGGGANLGASEVMGDILLFLNPDVILQPNAVSSLSSALRESRGVAGPLTTVGVSGALEYGSTINRLGMPSGLSREQPPLYVGGFSLATNRSVFEQVGGFDDRYFLFVEDTEYCWRCLNAGYEVSCVLKSRVWHRGGGSVPGGYPEPMVKYSTSTMRVVLRERNTIAMFVSCAPASWIPVIVPLAVGRSLLIAAMGLVLRKPSITSGILKGIFWNFFQLPRSINRRRSLQRTHQGVKRARSRFTHYWAMIAILKTGLPRIS